MTTPSAITLDITPRARLDVIDVTRQMKGDFLEKLNRYRRVFYCSHHTTAGFLEQGLCSRLDHNPERVSGFIGAFQRVFPPQADYQHDQIHLREDLTDLERETEPRNADSHLTYISSGLKELCFLHSPPADSGLSHRLGWGARARCPQPQGDGVGV